MRQMRKMQTFSAIMLVALLMSSPSVLAVSQSPVSQSVSDTFFGSIYRAVLVGIGQSQDLPFSVQQLKGFTTTITRGGLFSEDKIHTLFDEQATVSNIETEIAWLADTADADDVSLFYFVGHGSTVSTNTLVHAADTVITDEQLAGFMENISGSLIIIIDTCYSGGMIDVLEGENRTILTACAEDESTYQVHDLQSGIFGFFLNMSLAWCTKNIESTFMVANLFARYYSLQLSKEYGDEYRVYPQMSDDDPGLTWMLLKHAYGRQLISLMQQMMDTDGRNQFWRMDY